MKKAILLMLGAAVFLGFFAVSCSSDKKKKLTSNTAVIIIDPPDLSEGIVHGSSVAITGRISSDSNATIETWTIDPAILGTINESTIAYNTNSIKYVAPASGDAAGYIQAQWKDLTTKIKVAIGTCAVSSGGETGGVDTTTFVFFRDGFTPESGLDDTWYWTGGSGVTWDTSIIQGHDGSQRTCFWYEYTAEGTVYNGISFVYKHSTSETMDLSSYSKLIFWARGDTATDTKILVWAQGNDNGVSTEHDIDANVANDSTPSTISNVWTKIEIPLTKTRTSVKQPFVVVFAKDRGITQRTKVWVDDVYLEQ
jgi:hypothetical protein